MANKRLFNYLQSMRVDVPHMKMSEDSTLFDFKSLLQAFTSDSPYVLRGFNITGASNYISALASTIQVTVSDSCVWMPNQADGAFLNVAAGTPNEILNSTNTKVSGSFTSGATNYVSIILERASDPSTNDLVSFWDVDAKVEFTKTVPLGLILNYKFVVNTSGFGTNLPLAIIEVDSVGNATRITNAKSSMFRLGSGGASPNPYYASTFATNPENPLSVTSVGQPDPFTGADWEITNFKQWMDYVMTMFKNVTGSPYWYSNGSTLVSGINLSDLYFDSNMSVITGVGAFKHSDATPGMLTWTSDLKIRSILGPLTFTVNQGSVTLSDTQVAYITLQRHVDFQSTNTFTFTNASPTVTALNTITGIIAGDYIKFVSHDITRYVKVSTVVGSTITLVSNYLGATSIGKALKATGSYTATTANPESVPANSSTYWIAKRDDNAFTSLLIETVGNSGLERASDVTTVKTALAHGLIEGQSVAISGASISSFDGTFEVASILSSTTFTVENPGSDVGPGLAGGGLVSSVPKIYLRLRGGNGELQQGEEAQIDDSSILNILRFVGAESETDTTPPYTIFPNGLSTHSYTTNSSLTQAISATQGNVNDILTTLDQPAYLEPLTVIASGIPTNNEIVGPIAPATIITLPLHSRDGMATKSYVVGKGALEVRLNGQILSRTDSPNILGGWSEVGAPASNSTTIQIDQDLIVSDVLEFNITGAGGGGGSAAADDNFVTLPISAAADNADYILTYDTSASAYKRQSRSVFLSGLNGNLSVTSINVNYSALSGDQLIAVDASLGTVTVSLPTAVGIDGKVYYVKKVDATANSVVIDAAGAETLDGAPAISFSVQWTSFTVVSDGSNWLVV